MTIVFAEFGAGFNILNMLLTHCKTLRINFLNIFHPDQLICCNLMKWVTKTTVQTRAQNDSAESWGNKDKMEKWSNREEKSKDFPMTLSSSPHSSVWTLDPLDQFMAKVWAKDEKRSEKNHLICKFRNDCVLGTRIIHQGNVSLNCHRKAGADRNIKTKAKSYP